MESHTKLLDSHEEMAALDPSGMLQLVGRSADLMQDARAACSDLRLPYEGMPFRNVVACGLGGSAIGFDFLRAYLGTDLDVPLQVSRDYSVPGSVNEATLALVSSYSGNTEETLSSLGTLLSRNAKVICLASGGALAEVAAGRGLPLLRLPPGLPPRTAMGYSATTALGVLSRLGLVSNRTPHIHEAIQGLRGRIARFGPGVPSLQNPAKQLAMQLHGRIAVFYGSQDRLDVVARRWAAQMTENAQQLAYSSSVPEMTHNEVVGWCHPKGTLKQLAAVFLSDRGDHPRNRFRAQWARKRFSQLAGWSVEIESDGEGWLDRLWGLIILGDYASVYLAFLNQEDPSPVHVIEDLKNDLKEM